MSSRVGRSTACLVACSKPVVARDSGGGTKTIWRENFGSGSTRHNTASTCFRLLSITVFLFLSITVFLSLGRLDFFESRYFSRSWTQHDSCILPYLFTHTKKPDFKNNISILRLTDVCLQALLNHKISHEKL